MESSKTMLIVLLVLPSVLSQTTGMSTDLQTSAVATDLPTEAATTLPEMSDAPATSGNTGAPATPGKTDPEETEGTDSQLNTETSGQTEGTVPDNTEATDDAGQTEGTVPDNTEATDDAGQTEATSAPGETEASTTPGKTEDPNTQRTTREAIEPEEVILTVTTALVNYPDDKIITVGGGALVTISATVEIVNQVNGSVDVIDDMRVFVYAADSEMEELSSGIEVSLDPFNLTVNESVSFNKLNATLALNDVLCTTFTHVCVRVEPATNAVWKIAAEGSTDRSCDEISCESGSAKLAVSGILLALCFFISRLSGGHGD